VPKKIRELPDLGRFGYEHRPSQEWFNLFRHVPKTIRFPDVTSVEAFISVMKTAVQFVEWPEDQKSNLRVNNSPIASSTYVTKQMEIAEKIFRAKKTPTKHAHASRRNGGSQT